MSVQVSDVIVLKNVMVPMRDGVHLATDIYMQKERLEPLAALLERIPYNKCGTNGSDRSVEEPQPLSKPQVATKFAQAGYAYVIQDCRGRYASEGNFIKYLSEGEDGEDTIKWIRTQSWSNGLVGTLGLSYGAHVQTALAAHAPPGLGAMIIDSGGFSSAFHSGIRQGGAFEGKQLTWAIKHAGLAQATQEDLKRKELLQAEAARLEDWMSKTPWTTGNSPLAAAPEYESYLLQQWQHEIFDSFWKHPALYARGYYESFPDVPICIVCSWYDPYSKTSIENFVGLGNKSAPRRLLLGPWTHGQRSSSFSGDVDFGAASVLDKNVAPDFQSFRTTWFDVHLKNKSGAFDEYMPTPVKIFVMGGGSGRKNSNGRIEHGGCWRDELGWPIPRTVVTPLYFVGGLLSPTPSVETNASRSFQHDPRVPIQTNGGAIASGAPLMRAGAFDQGPVCDDSRVLSFCTEPLEHSIEVTGIVRVYLFVSSSADDTDITLKLMDVYPPNADYPNGYAMNLSHGILRMRFRDGYESIQWMEPTKVYEVEIELYPTSNLFERGHQIRIDVSSSNFPHFDLNFNTATAAGAPSPSVIAENTIYMDATRQSRVFLPVVPC